MLGNHDGVDNDDDEDGDEEEEEEEDGELGITYIMWCVMMMMELIMIMRMTDEDEEKKEEEVGELGSTCIMWCVSSSILLRRPAMLEKS